MDTEEQYIAQPQTVEQKYAQYILKTVFTLCIFVSMMGLLLFLKLGLKSIPILVFTMGLNIWVLAQNELYGFFPEEYGLKNAFGGFQLLSLIILISLQFFAGVLGTLSW